MELQRILARDTRSAMEQVFNLYGDDAMIVTNNRVKGQTEIIVKLKIELKMKLPQNTTKKYPKNDIKNYLKDIIQFTSTCHQNDLKNDLKITLETTLKLP